MKRNEVSRHILSADSVRNRKYFGGLHYTVTHRGKMSGVFSLSTCSNSNPFCLKSQNIKGSVCQHCFAAFKVLPAYAASLTPMLKQNAAILTGRRLKKDELPIIPTQLFRFESFGDLQSITQVINYFAIAKHNPHVKCALWTKRPGFISMAIKAGCKKPRNLQIVLSSIYLNRQAEPRFDFIDKVFTVYDKDYIKNFEVDINCGAKSCLLCRQCYEKNNVKFVNEILK